MNAYSQVLGDVAEEHDGPATRPKEIDIPEELLWGLYWGNCYTLREIGEIFDSSHETIRKRMEGFGIPTYQGYKGEYISSDIQQQIFEGCMLGDGGMTFVSDYPNFIYTDEYKDYLLWLSDLLGISEHWNIGRDKRNDAFYLQVSSMRGFGPEYNRWYPDGSGTIHNQNHKIIPHDLELTSVSILFWYIGDGCYDGRDGSMYFTNHLNRDDGEFLQKEIKNVLNVKDGITLVRDYDVYHIRLSKQVRNRFYELIKETGFEVPECYWYKFGIGE